MEQQETITDRRTEEEKDRASGQNLADAERDEARAEALKLLPKLPLEDYQRLIDFIEGQGRKRAWEQGVEFSEVDYLMGAYAVLAGMGWGGEVPAPWIFGPLRDEPVLQTAAQKRRYRLWCGANNARLERLKDTVKDALRHAEAAVGKLEVLEDVILGYEDTDSDN